MAATKIILDSGPLVGFVSETDQHHRWASEIWGSLYEPLWTCEAVLSETIFLLQSDGNSIDTLLELFERELGLVPTDFARLDWLKRFESGRSAAQRNLAGEGHDRTAFTHDQVKAGRFPAYAQLLTPDTRRRIETLYAIDFDTYRDHL